MSFEKVFVYMCVSVCAFFCAVSAVAPLVRLNRLHRIRQARYSNTRANVLDQFQSVSVEFFC